MTEQEIVKKCLTDIYKKCGYTNLDNLTQRDFDHVSQEIENNTGTLISGSTIKRLLHGEFSKLPQAATLHAISGYLGYKNWQEYKVSLSRVTESGVLQKQDNAQENKNHIKPSVKFKRFRSVALITTGCAVIAILIFISFSERKKLPDYSKAFFTAHKSTANEIPNTVVFQYNVDDVAADSFFIQQSWDRNRRVRVFKNNYTLTDIYYEPGYHLAKLIANDSIIRTIDISIPTDRWFMFAKYITSGAKPEYLKIDKIVRNGFLTIDKSDLEKNQVDVRQEKEYVYTFFPSKMIVNSDNYELRTRLRMKEVKNNFCPYVMIEVFCQRYFMFFKSTSAGCVSEASLQFGEDFIDGKRHDLSSMGYTMSKWIDVKISVIHKNVTISFNDKKVFSTSYKKNTGLVTGLGFISNGLCEIDFVELKGLDGTIVYKNDFDAEKNLYP